MRLDCEQVLKTLVCAAAPFPVPVLGWTIRQQMEGAREVPTPNVGICETDAGIVVFELLRLVSGLRALERCPRVVALRLRDLPLPGADRSRRHQRQRHRTRRGKRHLIPPNRFLESVRRCRRTSRHRLVVQMPFDVHCHATGRLVAAAPILLQALHHDPIQIAQQRPDQLRRFGCPPLRRRRLFLVL